MILEKVVLAGDLRVAGSCFGRVRIETGRQGGGPPVGCAVILSAGGKIKPYMTPTELETL